MADLIHAMNDMLIDRVGRIDLRIPQSAPIWCICFTGKERSCPRNTTATTSSFQPSFRIPSGIGTRRSPRRRKHPFVSACMISFKDFSPPISGSNFFSGTNFMEFQECLREANSWMHASGIVPLSVETLLLPGQEPDSSSGGYQQLCEGWTTWRQVLRVWYNLPPLPPSV